MVLNYLLNIWGYRIPIATFPLTECIWILYYTDSSGKWYLCRVTKSPFYIELFNFSIFSYNKTVNLLFGYMIFCEQIQWDQVNTNATILLLPVII